MKLKKINIVLTEFKRNDFTSFIFKNWLNIILFTDNERI